MSKEDKKFFVINLIKDPGERKNWAKDNPNKVEALALLAKNIRAILKIRTSKFFYFFVGKITSFLKSN